MNKTPLVSFFVYRRHLRDRFRIDYYMCTIFGTYVCQMYQVEHVVNSMLYTIVKAVNRMMAKTSAVSNIKMYGLFYLIT